MKRFEYRGSDGHNIRPREDALRDARVVLEEEGGILLDDSRAIIHPSDDLYYDELVRVARDEMGADMLDVRLGELTAAGWDWNEPLSYEELTVGRETRPGGFRTV